MHLSDELSDAASRGNIEKIRQLAAQGHDLNLAEADEGEDLLCLFMWQCTDVASLKELLALGCRPLNQPCIGGTPLIPGVWSKEPEIVKTLLDAGCDPNVLAFVDEQPTTALDAALDDYCVCDTPEEMQAMEAIEALIRAAGGTTHSV